MYQQLSRAQPSLGAANRGAPHLLHGVFVVSVLRTMASARPEYARAAELPFDRRTR